VRSPATLDPEGTGTIARLAQDTGAAKVIEPTRRFAKIVRRGRVGELGARDEAAADPAVGLVEARRCGVPAVTTFAAGLEQDGAAVRAALMLPWSRGQAEGQITRVQLLKRSRYGRATFDLLRRRVLPAA
jgi:hypothetical protein